MLTINQDFAKSHSNEKTEISAFAKAMNEIEKGRLVTLPLLLLPLLCLSGIVAGFGTDGDLFQMIFLLIPNALALTFTLGIAPFRWVTSAFLATIIMDLLILFI